MAELTAEDYKIVQHFWEEKDDITARAAWGGKKHLFRKRHPELVQAAKQLVIAELTLFAIVKTICSENT